MFFGWLKQYMPRSLYGRAALILLVPIVTLQIVISISFVQRYFEDVTQQMTHSVILELEYLRRTVATATTLETARSAVTAVAEPLELSVQLPAPPAPSDDTRSFYDLSGRAMIETLRQELPDLGPVDLGTDRQVALWIGTD